MRVEVLRPSVLLKVTNSTLMRLVYDLHVCVCGEVHAGYVDIVCIIHTNGKTLLESKCQGAAQTFSITAAGQF